MKYNLYIILCLNIIFIEEFLCNLVCNNNQDCPEKTPESQNQNQNQNYYCDSIGQCQSCLNNNCRGTCVNLTGRCNDNCLITDKITYLKYIENKKDQDDGTFLCVKQCNFQSYQVSNIACKNCNDNYCEIVEDRQNCDNDNNCFRCKENTFKQSSNEYDICDTDCPQGTIKDTLQRLCLTCDASCDTNVTGDICQTTSTNCQQCDQNQVKVYKKEYPGYSECLQQCQNDQFSVDTPVKHCQQCSTVACNPEGLMCQGGQFNCLACIGDYYKQQRDDSGYIYECMTSCNINYIKNNSNLNNQYCEPCDTNQCFTSNSIIETCKEQTNKCFQCKNTYYKINETNQHEICTDNCGQLKFKVELESDLSNNVCRDCSNVCLITQNILDPTCQTSENNCYECIDNYYKQINQRYSICQTECLDNFKFKHVDTTNGNVCEYCNDDICQTQGVTGKICEDSQPLNNPKCQKCKTLYKQIPAIGSQFANCDSVCPDGYYGNDDNNQCELCDSRCFFQTGSNQTCQYFSYKCAKCKSGYYKKTDTPFSECVIQENCPQGTIPIEQNNNNNICQLCSQDACFDDGVSEVCRGGQFNCKQCKGDYFRIQSGVNYGECSQDCNDFQKFKNYDTQNCEECDIVKCEFQSSPTKSQCQFQKDKCLKCQSGYYKLDKQQEYSECVEQCPSGYFQTQDPTLGNICEKCSEKCDKSVEIVCNVQADLCTKCVDPYFKQSNQPQDTCENNCLTGQFQNDTDNICEQCDQNKCDVSLVDSCVTFSDNCKKCKDGYYKQSNNGDNNYDFCKINCPQGKFQNQTDNVCEDCDSNSCDNTLSTNPVCQTQFECYKCATGYYRWFPTEYSICKLECDTGYYKNIDTYICEKCNSICKLDVITEVCKNGEYNCHTCTGDYYKQDTNDIYSICKYQYCGKGKYMNSTTNTCDVCGADCNLSLEQACQKDNPDKCRNCINNKYKLLNSEIYSECVDSQNCGISQYPFNDTNNYKLCLPCIKTMNSICKDVSATQPGKQLCQAEDECLECEDGYFQYKFDSSEFVKCLKVCPSGYYTTTGDNNCKKCSTEACDFTQNQVCQNSEFQCKQCIGSYYKIDDTQDCVQTCPQNTVKEENHLNNICRPCSGQCLNEVEPISGSYCLKDFQDHCYKCISDLYKKNSEDLFSVCVTNCPNGEFILNGECTKCSTVCDQNQEVVCYGANNQCSECLNSPPNDIYYKQIQTFNQGFYECKKTCEDGYFKFTDPQTNLNSCEKCSDQCVVSNDTCQDNSYNCNKCQGIYYKQTKDNYSLCDTQCQNNQFQKTQTNDNICEDCPVECSFNNVEGKICQDETGLCKECSTGFKQNNSEFSVCVTDCGNNFIENQDSKTCQECSSKCQDPGDGSKWCSILPLKCKTCQSQYVKQICQSDYCECIDKCPPGQVSSNGQCVECHSNCDLTQYNACDNTNINSCKNCTLLYKQDIQQTYSQCVTADTCPQFTLAHFNTSTRYGSCISCDTNFCAADSECQNNIQYCSKCKVGLYKQKDQPFSYCDVQCPSDHMSNNEFICQQCDYAKCQIQNVSQPCKDQVDNCKVCKLGLFKQTISVYGNCVENCDFNWYEQENDSTCQQCNNQYCEDDNITYPEILKVCKDQADKCFKCKPGYYKIQQNQEYSQCQQSCPSLSQFKDNNTCQDCDNNICNFNISEQVCIDQNNKCKQCANDYFKPASISSNGYYVCILINGNDCPSLDTYLVMREGNNTCEQCDISSCHSNDPQGNQIIICKQHPQNCQYCKGETYKELKDDQFSMCKLECPVEFFKVDNINGNYCEQCDSVTCTYLTDQPMCKDIPTNCKQCKDPYYKEKSQDPYSKCVQNCPFDTYKITQVGNNLCQQCHNLCEKIVYNDQNQQVHACSVNSNSCYQCVAQYFKKYPSQDYSECINECPIGFYPNGQVCGICHQSCEQCEGPSDTDCTVCKQDLFLNQLSGRCRVDCSDMISYYPNTSTRECQQCSKYCQTCYGPSNTQCYECKANTRKIPNGTTTPQTYTCEDYNCSQNQYHDKETDTCLPCNSNCSTCQDTAENCLTCYPFTYFWENKCLNDCPPNTFIKDNSLCIPCNNQCFSCDGPNFDECTECNPNYEGLILQNKQCVCPQNTYKNDSQLKCQPPIDYTVQLLQEPYQSPNLKIKFEEELNVIPDIFLEQIQIAIKGLRPSQIDIVTENQITQRFLKEEMIILDGENEESEIWTQTFDDNRVHYTLVAQKLTKQEIDILIKMDYFINDTTMVVKLDFQDLFNKEGVPVKSYNYPIQYEFGLGSILPEDIYGGTQAQFYLDIGNTIQESDIWGILQESGLFLYIFNPIVLPSIFVLMDINISDKFYNISRLFSLLIFDDCVQWNIKNINSSYITDNDIAVFETFQTNDFSLANEHFQRLKLWGNFLQNGYILCLILLGTWFFFFCLQLSNRNYQKVNFNSNTDSQLSFISNETFKNQSFYSKVYYFSYKLKSYSHDFLCFPIFLYICLQIQNIRFEDFYDFVSIASVILVLIGYIMVFLLMIRRFNLSKNQFNNSEEKQQVQWFYGSFIDNLQYKQYKNEDFDFLVQNYHILSYGKKILIPCILVFLYQYPEVQLFSILFILLVYFIYTATLRPFKLLLIDILKISADFIICIVVIITILSHYAGKSIKEDIVILQTTISSYKVYGTIQIIGIYIFLALHLLINCVLIIKYFQKIIKNFLKTRNNNKQQQIQYSPKQKTFDSEINNNSADVMIQHKLIDHSKDDFINKQLKFYEDNLNDQMNKDGQDKDNIQNQNSKQDLENQSDQKEEIQQENQNQENDKNDIQQNEIIEQLMNDSNVYKQESKIQSPQENQIEMQVFQVNDGPEQSFLNEEYSVQGNNGKEQPIAISNVKQNSSIHFSQPNSQRTQLSQQDNEPQLIYPQFSQKQLVFNKYVYIIEFLDQKSMFDLNQSNTSKNQNQEHQDIYNGLKVLQQGHQIQFVLGKPDVAGQDPNKYDLIPQYIALEPFYVTQAPLQQLAEIFIILIQKYPNTEIQLEKEERVNLQKQEIGVDKQTSELLIEKKHLDEPMYFVRIDGKRKKYTGKMYF